LSAKDLLNGFLKSRFNIQTADHRETTIYKIFDEKSHQYLQLCLLNNIIIASYNKSLIEASIDEASNHNNNSNEHFYQIYDKLNGDGLLRFYIIYQQLNDYTNQLLTNPDPDIAQLGKSLYVTGLALNIDNDNLIRCEGYTNYNDTIPSSLRAIAKSGTGKTGLADVLPIQTATSFSFGFDRFTDYFDNMMVNMKDIPKQYNEYQSTIKKVESYLKIDIRKNVMSWIGDEAAMVQFPPMGLGKDNEFAVFLKSRNINDAKENLGFIAERIRKRTPVKFDQVEYNGYYINYLSMKGFFRMILGKYFQKLDKPYYTYIGDYVVFSNHPQTLKVIIDGMVNPSLLKSLPDYTSFTKNFSRHSNILMIVNTVNFIKSIQGSINASTLEDLQKNKEYINCFPFIGFQLEHDQSIFKTKLYVKFQNNEIVKDTTKIQSTDTISGNLPDTVKTDVTEQQKEEISMMLKAVDDYIPDDVNSTIYHESYSNGQIKVEFELKDGFRSGSYKEYYENGKLKIKGQYKKDHKDGTWKFTDKDGKLIQKVKFIDGKRE
jgi:antitoxin component YwqK of YwqJK toxin-antitoxin module